MSRVNLRCACCPQVFQSTKSMFRILPVSWVQEAPLPSLAPNYLSRFSEMHLSICLSSLAGRSQSMCSQYQPGTNVKSSFMPSSFHAHLTFSMSPGCTSGCVCPHSLAAALATERCSGVRPSSSKEPSMLLKKRWLLWMASRAAFSFAGCLGTSRLQAGQTRGVDRRSMPGRPGQETCSFDSPIW